MTTVSNNVGNENVWEKIGPEKSMQGKEIRRNIDDSKTGVSIVR